MFVFVFSDWDVDLGSVALNLLYHSMIRINTKNSGMDITLIKGFAGCSLLYLQRSNAEVTGQVWTYRSNAKVTGQVWTYRSNAEVTGQVGTYVKFDRGLDCD